MSEENPQVKMTGYLKAAMSDITIHDVLTNAIRYWERGRILYNAVLAVIVIAYFVMNLPGAKGQLNFDLAQSLFILAVFENAA